MPLSELNHYFVRANDLKATRNFYVDVLGFEEMPRPDFPFPGYWLGVGGKIQVHMAPHNIPNKEKYYLGTPKNAATDQTGVVDHIAFLATEPQEFVARFQRLGLEFRPRYLAESNLYQLMIRDPDGLMIELNFFGITDAPEWSGEDYAQMARVEEQA
ncbi:MAG: VOC family protein [Proteobacteria bacterium]|nr:VOC family protein [Pseudomonadota bacterium]MDA1118039.1 VOC family protein [Pseudomonadota bacterium]